MNRHHPVVLCFSGHDPSGGAGIQADIEAIISHQCHACSVITALTEQDSHNVKKLIPQKSADIFDQAQTILNDFQVKAIKIGLLGHHETISAIHSILLKYPNIPVILDPVLAAGGGKALANEKLISGIINQLLPLVKILTPNSDEARLLTNKSNLVDCANKLLANGCEFVLTTGTHEQSTLVINQLFQNNEQPISFNWDRLPYSYHGSGCTLGSTIAALIALGLDPFTAISEAQEYTWNSLNAAYTAGNGQLNPNRLFWMEGNE